MGWRGGKRKVMGSGGFEIRGKIQFTCILVCLGTVKLCTERVTYRGVGGG